MAKNVYVLASEGNGAQDFLRLLAITALIIKQDDDQLKKNISSMVRPLFPSAVAFLKEQKIPIRAFQAMILALGADVPPEAEAKEFRNVFYPTYKEKFKTKIGVFSAPQQKFIDAVLAFFNRKSENSFNDTRNTIAALNDRELSRLFAIRNTKFSDSDIDTLIQEMQAFRIDKNGKPLPIIINPEMATAFKEKAPKKYAEWNERYKLLRNIYRDEVKVIVRRDAKDDGLIPIKELRSKLAKVNAILPEFLPIGIDELQLNENNKMYTPEGVAIMSGTGGGAEPMPKTVYRVNKTFSKSARSNPAYLLYNNAVGGEGRLYLETKRQESRNKKAKVVNELLEAWPSIEPNLTKALSSTNYDTRLLATVLMLIYETAGRVGGDDGLTKKKMPDGTVKDVKTFGISSILRKHVKIAGNTLTISYPGKKAVEQEHIVKGNTPTNKKIVENIKSYIEGLKPNDRVFVMKNGSPLPSAKLNEYLKSFGVSGASVHKLRHVNGDSIVMPLFEKYKTPSKATQRDLFVDFKDILTKVGEKLGHKSGDKVTWTTAHQNYVSPSLQKDFFISRGFNPPAQVLKLQD